MNNDFGKRHPKPNAYFLNKPQKSQSRIVAGIGAFMKLIWLIIIVLLIMTFLKEAAFTPLLAMGMLGDPFKTTRKMQVPYHARKGHREKAFDKFATFLVVLVAIGLLAGVVHDWFALHP